MLETQLSCKQLVNRLLLDYDNESFCNDICTQITSEILRRNISFLEVVEDLEALMTNPDIIKHSKALNVLSHLIELLPRGILTTKELEIIVQFFCSQLNYHHSFVGAILKGMVPMVQIQQPSKEMLHKITSTLFKSIVWQAQTQSDRKLFYLILQYIIFNRLEDYRNISSDLLFNVITSIDGERDPRNLLLIFSFLPTLYSSFPLGSLTEDAFEAVSCYFPIDFNYSVSDYGAVTKEDLVSVLTPCLLALPNFATYCILLIQEKLDSTMKAAKIESYKLLIEGCKVWPSQDILSHFQDLWLAMKQDIFPPRDVQIATLATQAFQSLIKSIPEPSLCSVLPSIISSCEGFLSDIQLTLFEPSYRLLVAAMSASPVSCNIIIHKLLPTLISQLCKTQGTTKTLILDKLKAAIQVFLCNSNSDSYSGGDSWNGLQIELSSCLEDDLAEVQEAAYSVLSLITKYVDIDCRHRLYQTILLHLTIHQSKLVRCACIKLLQAMASMFDEEVQINVAKHLSVCQDNKEDLSMKQNKFEAICSLALVERFQPMLDYQFVNLISLGQPYLSVAIHCLRNLLETKEVQDNKTLVNFLFSQSSVLRTLTNVDCQDSLLDSAKIIQVLVCSQRSSEQMRVVQLYVKVLLNHANQTHQMVFLNAFLGSLWPDVAILPLEEIRNVVLPAVLNASDNSLLNLSSLQLLSTLVNKSSDDSLLELISQHLESCSTNRAITIHAFIIKALVFRGHPHMKHWLIKFLDYLDCEEYAQFAIEWFEFIVLESQEFLSLKNHCYIKLFYRQRLFHIVVTHLFNRIMKSQHLKVLTSLLQSVPHFVYMEHITQIMPLLVKSLDAEDDAKLPLGVLHTLCHILSMANPFFEDQTDTVIPRFLNLAKFNPYMKVRIAALQCLTHLLNYSTVVLLPHKQQVLAELMSCLDDKKRLVRKEAAHTRSKWFLLGALSQET